MSDFLKLPQFTSTRRRFLGGAASAVGAPILLGLPGLITSAQAATPLPRMDEKDAVIAFGHPPRAEPASRG